MEVAYAILATAAETTPDGKVHILNGDIDTLRGPFPGVITTPLYLAVRILLTGDERGKDHSLVVRWVAPSESVVAEAKGELSSLTGAKGQMTKITSVVPFIGIVLPEVGQYTIQVEVDGQIVKALPINAEAVEEPAGT
jgi:hypothetical protein